MTGKDGVRGLSRTTGDTKGDSLVIFTIKVTNNRLIYEGPTLQIETWDLGSCHGP